MIKCNEFNKGNKRKEVVGRYGNFVMLVIQEKVEFYLITNNTKFTFLSTTYFLLFPLLY